MVKPSDLINTHQRDVLEGFEAGALSEEARNEEAYQSRGLFRRGVYERKIEEVYLPILIIPGVASSGLYVEESSVDDKFIGVRLWMNAGFLARARMNNKVINAEAVELSRTAASSTSSEPTKNRYMYSRLHKLPGGESFTRAFSDFSEIVKGALDDNSDEEEIEEAKSAFRGVEEEIAIKSSWIQHVALGPNMIDERPGNKVRAYEGLDGCEYLVDSMIEKTQGYVMGPFVDYCTTVMAYERGKSIDAMPYDWRLAPSVNEKRDGYLTKMIARIERMYEENGELPIVLVCHSMGAKMGHYFLNFALREKGQDWLDKHVHTYMPIGGPHGGVGCAVRCGVTGKGLDDIVDMLVGNVSDGLIMYRSWSCGNWLMPRTLPAGVFPTCIVRREGELGVTLTSEIDVAKVFAKRDKKPKELRLTVIFRDKVHAHTEFSKVVTKKNHLGKDSMTVSFDETFYMAVPYLGENPDEIGELMIYLEEPAGRVNQNKSGLGKTLSNATRWARSFKKKASKFYRELAKRFGSVLRVAMCDRPMVLNLSDFNPSSTLDLGSMKLAATISMVGCHRGNFAVDYSDSGSDDEGVRKGKSRRSNADHTESSSGGPIGSISLMVRYTPPPKSSGTKPSPTPIAMIHEETPKPPVLANADRRNTTATEQIHYDVWNGTDVFKADGFVAPMFDLVRDTYEGDPIGPTKESSLDAPPVNCVRSIYGINTPTEAGAIYRKVDVVTVGDNEADCRYKLDTRARFPSPHELGDDADEWSKTHLHTYKVKGGIVYETPETLQAIPGQSELRKVCGDGTVPYWNMIHPLSWKDQVKELTVDELDGASHRDVVADQRFFALMKRYCKVIDPRANAMLMAKQQNSKALSGGINSLRSCGGGSDDDDDADAEEC
mmetsp:Transcript_10832/g.31519  ORF Transcript_10832/g.31519 Transcript_10832/m.31519 type:complete len:887 (+) Transcript_10832:178-2838(+)